MKKGDSFLSDTQQDVTGSYTVTEQASSSTTGKLYKFIATRKLDTADSIDDVILKCSTVYSELTAFKWELSSYSGPLNSNKAI